MRIESWINDYKVYINFVANTTNFLGMVSFLIFVYGRKESKVYNHPRSAPIIKVGLATTALGCLWSAITFSNPEPSEVLLNVGLSITFLWAAWFHYTEFVAPKKSKSRAKNSKS
jgi:hypothetical protein